MGYNETVLGCVVGGLALGFIVSFIINSIIQNHATYTKETKIYSQGYSEGFEFAKTIFYTDPRVEARHERDENLREVMEANKESKPPISSEILMAYGVARTSQLPREVRLKYNVDHPTQDYELSDLIRMEVKDNDRH